MTKNILYNEKVPEYWLTTEFFHAIQLLPELQKPTVVKYASKNATEGARWVVTLQHANESSGLYALADTWKKLYSENVELGYDLYFLIVNGYGAMMREYYPMFDRRFAPDQIDFNRCWTKPGEKGREDMPMVQREQIEELTEIILQTNPEYIIDVHNTTGKNKPLAFVQEKYAHSILIHNLVDHIIYSGPLPGSLLDRFSDICETITIECGKTGTLEAFTAGKEMINQCIQYKKEDQKKTYKNPLFYKELGRMVIKDKINFSFYNVKKETHLEKNKFFVRSDIEDLNQTSVQEFGPLGCYEGDDFPLCFLEHGLDKSEDYLQVCGREIEIAKPTYGLLFTTNAHNIRVTELGYLMERI
ncbi:succinylglutamate desuccinylase/aspartoacylase family protein [Candidatus Woesearchaeota archaeon]|nr:succinylglutamate desuccinylase/aspartoacylase family protein [Candidatus Woesearchaeota archaeon]